MLPAPVNSTMFEHLASLGVVAGSHAHFGILSMLGVGPGEHPAVERYPILGYHCTVTTTSNGALLLLYMVTPGKLLRYEWSKTATMSVTLPIERVSCVTETTNDSAYQLSIELDAQVTVAISQSELRTHPDHDSADDDTRTTGQHVTRTERATYTLLADGDPQQLATLSSFSRALRLALGN